MIILSDIISFNDPVIKSLSVKYKNRLMVRDSMTIDALNSLCTVQWLTRMKNYTQIIGD
jgi:hypothetical protein